SGCSADSDLDQLDEGATAADPDASDGGEPDTIDWGAVIAAVDSHEIPDITLLVGDASGVLLTHDKGSSTADDQLRIGSATKWLTAATIMSLVERGVMAQADRPQDYINNWTTNPSDGRSGMTIDALLSFTSGFAGNPGQVECTTDPSSDLTRCVAAIYASQFAYPPGTTYHYGPSHMHTAARMAERATGSSWPDIVIAELAAPLGIEDQISWAMASPEHPMPSGGLRTSANAYARFLTALAAGELLASRLADMAEPRTVGLAIGNTPIDSDIGPWQYGLGQWRECSSPTWDAACESRVISSSPGAFGFYPWFDHDSGYWAILAAELPLVPSNPPTDRVIPLGVDLQPLIRDALGR
ncbi:MAG: serine hydrolase domain-containing protein, partial [Myxococcota bacterium]